MLCMDQSDETSFTRTVKVTVFVLFKNGYNSIMLKRPKVLLTKTVTLTGRVNKSLQLHLFLLISAQREPFLPVAFAVLKMIGLELHKVRVLCQN